MVADGRKAKIIGVGLDNSDGKVRVTRAENFHLVGGSQETHEVMQEKAVKFNEKLDSRSKQLEQLEPQEFLDIAAECDMNILAEPNEPQQ